MADIPNGIYTITNEAGKHITLRVHTKQGGKYKGSRQVSLLVGPDNTKDYDGFGFVRDNGTIYLWKNKRGNKLAWYAKLLERAAVEINNIIAFDDPKFKADFTFLKGRKYTVLLSKKCKRCNRPLTDPESIQVGLGPVCRGERR